jgi:hypothetical protein
MLVNSETLLGAAAIVRKLKKGPQKLAEGPCVSAAQLETAARILQEAEPSVITAASGPVQMTLNKPEERPGFIEERAQRDPQILTFVVGILPSTTYDIDRKGKAVIVDGAP